VVCVMTRPVSRQTLRAAYCLQLLLADTGTAVAAAEAQEGTVPAGCSPAACHTGVGQRCRGSAGRGDTLRPSRALHSSTGIGYAIPGWERLWNKLVDRILTAASQTVACSVVLCQCVRVSVLCIVSCGEYDSAFFRHRSNV